MKPNKPRAIVFAVCFLILFARRPSTLLRPQFWAEDGTIFYRDQVLMGFDSLLHPCTGYFHLCSRVVAALGGALNAESAPLLYNAAALAIAALCCSEFARIRYRPLLDSDILRTVLCLLMASAIPAYELVGNLANLQWFIVVAAIPFLLVPEPADKLQGRFLYPAVGLFAALSAPELLILLPILFFQETRRKSAPPADR